MCWPLSRGVHSWLKSLLVMELPWSQAYGLPGHLKRGKSKNEYRQVYKNEESANLRFFSRNLDDKLTR